MAKKAHRAPKAAKAPRAKRGAAKKASTVGRTPLGKKSYGSNEYECYGKRVRAGRSETKIPRIFCARIKK